MCGVNLAGVELCGVAVEGGLCILLVQGRSPPFVSTGVCRFVY